jgi:hypothetical protein
MATTATTVKNYQTPLREADKTVLLRVEGSFYPNQEGNEDKTRVNSVTADELHLLNAESTTGGQTEAMFRRAK